MFSAASTSGQHPRGSDLHASAYQRIATVYDNVQVAQTIKKENIERHRAAQFATETRRLEMTEKVQNERKQQNEIRAKQEAIRDRKLKSKRAQRQLKAVWERQREERDSKHFITARAKVIEDKQVDERLDIQEELQNAKERAESSAAKAASRALLVQRRQQTLDSNRACVLALRVASINGREHTAREVESKRERVQRSQVSERGKLRQQREINNDDFLEKATKTTVN